MDLVSIVMALPKALSAIFNLYEGCNEVRDRFLIKKIIKFSEKKFDENIVHNFIESIDIDCWENIQEIVIHQLIQAESVVKAIYIRNLVEALLIRKITQKEFWKMNFVLQHLFTFDIEDLIGYYGDGECTKEQKKLFSLYELLTDETGQSFQGETLFFSEGYSKNEFGAKFVEAIKDC